MNTEQIALAVLLLIAVMTANASSVHALNVPVQSAYQLSSVPHSIQYVPDPGPASNASRYVTRGVSYTASRMGALARTALLSPGGVALSVAMIAAGYIIDDQTGNVTTSGGGLQTQNYYFYYDNPTYGGRQTGQTAQVAAVAAFDYWAANQGGGTNYQNVSCPGGLVTQNCTASKYIGTTPDGPATIQIIYTPGTYEYTDPGTTLDDTALGGLFEQGQPFNEYVPDVLTDPATGVPNQTQELTDVLNDVLSDFDSLYDNDPATNPTTNAVPNDTGVEGETDELIDCDFQPTLCRWLDWYRDGENEAVQGPVQDDLYASDDTLTYSSVITDFQTRLTASNFGSGLSNFFTVAPSGSCPVWTLPATYFTAPIPIDVQCSPVMDTIFLMVSAVLIATASFIGFRWAFL